MIGLYNWSKFTKSSAGNRLCMWFCLGTLLLFIPGFAQAQLFDITLSSHTVEEGVPSGTLVGTLSTPAILGTATFTLPADINDNELFSINGDQLLTAAVFDYEVKQTYTITIEASLLGLGLATEEFIIDIVDAETIVLDNNSINENEPSGTLVGIVSSNEETHSYTFLLPSGQNDNDFFSIIDEQLVSAAIFDYETQNTYTITIQAIDELNQISSENFTIHINDVGPTDLTISKNSIDENVPSGAIIGSFFATNGIAPVTYILIEGPGATDNDQFFVDGSELKTGNTFDFEVQSTYSIRVQATDATTDSFTKSFSISVNNLSEGPTDITLTNHNVNEHDPIGTLVGTLSAIDATGAVTYTLPAGQNDNDQFSIQGDQLLTNAIFDFENKSSYNITVQALDDGGTPFSKDFNIDVTDLPGPSNIALSNNSVEENQPAGTLIGTLSATDGTGDITFSLPSRQNDNDSFSINNDELQTGESFDLEVKDQYTITVIATDQNDESHTKDFTVNVLNVEEGPTNILLSNNIIEENATANTSIGTLSATGATGAVTYSLPEGQNDNELFTIQGNELLSNAVFNFEDQNSYTLSISATDENGSFEKTFGIQIEDNEGISDLTLSNNTIEENQKAGTSIGSFSASGNTGTVTYILPSGQSNNDLFSIDGSTLKTNAVLDFEEENTYTITVNAQDAEGNINKNFNINVVDVPEGPTDITLSASSVDENQPVGTIVGTLSAQDGTPPYSYSLVNGAGSTDNDEFSIEGDQIKTNAVFDFEEKNSYSIRIQTIDDKGENFAKAFTISVTNLVEAPTDLSLSASIVNENKPIGTPIGNFSSESGTAPFIYQLVSGSGDEDNDQFVINGDQLQSNAVFDFETKNSFSIRAQTTDNKGESFAKAFTISVNDVEEAPTDITLSNNAIEENAAVNTPIGTLSAAGATGTVTYSLPAGQQDNDQFIINGDQLLTNAVFDFETKSSYTITINAQDSEGVISKNFNISITDLPEAVAGFTIDNSTIPENQAAGTEVGTFSATGGNPPYTYAFVSGTGSEDNNLFNITGSKLTTKQPFDFEIKSSYAIRVMVTDNQGASLDKAFTITIENIQGPTSITLNPNEIEENQPGSTLVGTLSASGGTPPYNFAFVSGAGDANNGSFNIESGNQLTSTQGFDYEVTPSLSIRVIVTDSNNEPFNQALNISVLDRGPTDILLSDNQIEENQPVGSTVGSFSSVGGASPYAYTFVKGPSYEDNFFALAGNSLNTKTSFDFENKNSYVIRIRSTDAEGEVLPKDFTVSVTDAMEAPVVVNSISDFSVNEDAPNSTFELGDVFSHPNGGDLTYTVQNDNEALLTATISGATLALDYKSNQFGEATITVTASDEGESVQEVFVVTVNAVNDTPTASGIEDVNVNEDASPVNVNLYTAFADVEDADEALSYSVVSNSNAGLVSTSISKPNLTLSFAANQSGSANLTVRATDTGGEFVETSFTVNVEDVSNAPTVASSIADFSVNEDAANATIELDDVFSDADEDALSYSVQNSNTTLVQASISAATLTLDFQPNQSGQATITVTASDGSESVQDAFVVTVNAVNDTPTASNIADVNVSEDASPVNVNLYTAFADVEDADEALTYSVVSNSNTALVSTSISKPNLTLSFAANQNSSANITVEAVDAGGASVQTSFKVTVSAVNDKPTTAGIANVNVGENAADVKINLFNTFADVENTDAQLTYQVTNNSNPALVSTQIINPELILSFAPNASGSANLTVRATDTGGEFVETSFTVNVTEIASTPVVANPINDLEVNEDAANSTFNLSNVFSDADGDDLTYSVQNSNEALLTATISGATLTLDYQPDQSGQATITVTASDGSESVQDVFVVTVNPLNNPPSFIILGNPPASKEDAGPQKIAGFVSDINDGDGGSQTLSFNLTQTAFTGLLAFASGPSIDAITGDLTYTAEPNTFGTADYAVTLSDNGPTGGDHNNISEPQSFKIIVEPVADPPVVPTNVKINETETASGLAVERSANDSNEVTHFKITNITGGTLYQNDGTTPISNGTFITVAQGSAGLKFTPSQPFVGKGNFTATASTTNTDAGLGGASTAQLEILPFPDKPVVTHAETEEDTQTTSGLVIDRNPNDGGEVTQFRITNITGGQLFRNNGTTPINNGEFITYAAGNAGLKFTPSPNATENGTFTVQASGLLGLLLSDTAVAVIKVISVNDAPEVTAPPTATVDEDVALNIPDISVADVDLGDANLSVALSVENGILTLSQTNGLSFNAGSNGSTSMTINGNLTNVNNALGSLKYQGNDGFFGTETLAITASDNGATGEVGGEQTDTASVTITVNPLNDPPVLSGVEDKPLLYTEDAPATNISNTIALTDGDSETMLSASVKITANYKNTEDRLIFPADHPHLLGSFDVNTGELKLTRKNTGTDFSVSIFQNALRAVQYQNIETAIPLATTRTITFTVTDEAGVASVPVTRDIAITLANDPPVLFNIESSALTYTSSTFVQITNSISITDEDGGNIASASIKFAQNYVQEEDRLFFTPVAGVPITGTFFQDRGELVLQGVTTVVNYAQALKQVTYFNAEAFPTPGNRLVSFTVQDTDDNLSNELNRSIVVGNSDAPPTIFSFGKTANEDTNIGFSIDDFVNAYSDNAGPDAVPTEIRVRSIPQNGTLSLNGTEITQNSIGELGFKVSPDEADQLVYIPNEDYNGSDSFKWNAFDGSSFAANNANVNITITPVNDDPVISAPSSVEVEEDVPTVITDITVEDPDAGNGLLTVTLSVDIGTLSLTESSGLTFKTGDGELDKDMEFDGTLTNINSALNTLTYLSAENLSGSLEMEITVKDNGNTGGGNMADIALTEIEVIPVNDPPALANMETEALAYTENDPPLLITGNLTLEDVDDPQDAITQAIVTITEGYTNTGEELLTFTPSDGISGQQEENVLTLTGNASLAAYQAVLRSIMYENQSNNPGDTPRTISIQLTDEHEGQSNIVTRDINVAPVNDPPVLANIETEALPYYEGQTSAQITSALEAGDPDNESLSEATIQISENYVEGEDSLSVNGLVNITASWDSATGTLTLSGADAKELYQNALRSVNYHNNLNETPSTEPRAISFQISDGTDQSEIVTREITILPNDPPVVSSFEKNTDEDEALSFAVEDFSEQYEDDNIPTEGLAAVQILSLPPNGSLLFDEEEITQGQLDTEGLIITTEDIGKLVYLPNPDFSGKDSLGWTASDGIKTAVEQAYAIITVNPVNDPPAVGNFGKTGQEDTPLPFTAAEFNDHYADVENDGMQKVIIRGLPTHGVLKLNGFELPLNAEISTGNLNKLVYEPELNYSGEDSIRWSATDPASVSPSAALITLTIIPVNDAPEVSPFTKTSNENAPIPFTLADFANHFNDVENDELQKVVITRLPANGVLIVNEDPVVLNDTIDREDLDNLVYMPDADFLNGRDNFRWKASDDSLYSQLDANVNIIIGTGVTDFEVTTEEDSALTFVEEVFANNFNNASGGLSVIRIDSLPPHGTLTLNGADVSVGQTINKVDIPNLVYTPAPDFNGKDSLYWNGRNGGDFAPENAKILITVNPVNDAPVISEMDNQLILVNQSAGPLTFSVSDVDSTPETLLVTVSSDNENLIPNQEENLMLTTNEPLQYTLNITPLTDSTGSATITIAASDGKLSATSSFTINVVTLEVDAGDDLEIVEGESVEITATPIGGEAPFTFTWTCDQPECAIDDPTQATINVNPLQTTTYYVKVSEANDTIQTAKDTIIVNVIPRPTALDIPTGFTPDGVEPNNLWIIDDIELFENVIVEVYNRYGTRVFRSEGYNEPWNGTYNGDLLPVGTYYYVVNIDNGSQVYKGSVVILR